MCKTIYTVGKMKDVPFSKQMEWRRGIENTIQEVYLCHKFRFFHPPNYFNYEHNWHQSEKEVKEYELNTVRESDILIVNLDGINDSVGSHFEIALANAVNMFGDKHIYIIGLGDPEGVHPWILDSFVRVEANIESLCEYLIEYHAD